MRMWGVREGPCLLEVDGVVLPREAVQQLGQLVHALLVHLHQSGAALRHGAGRVLELQQRQRGSEARDGLAVLLALLKVLEQQGSEEEP